MPQYYCHQCAISASLVVPASPVSLTGTEYLLGKFIKHTAPASIASSGIHSVFTDPTYKTYEGYVVSTAASGFLKIDNNKKKDLIWFAGSRIGVQYQNGVFDAPTDGVKLVLPENESKMHAFSITASPLQSAFCASCGRAIPLY